MNFSLAILKMATWGACLLAMISCSGKERASTEVENEVQVSSIAGVAATGYAMSNATWEVLAASGVLVAQGTTNAYGSFQADMDTIVETGELPWLIRVFLSGDTLTGLLSANGSDTLFALVNPISDYVTRQLLGTAIRNPFEGFQPPPAETVDQAGQDIVEEILGRGFTWREFHSDRSYRAAVLTPPQGYIPSPNDMLVHSLSAEAARLGISRNQLMDSLYRDADFSAMAEKDFRLDVAANMALFGIPPDSAQPKLQDWQKNQGIEDESVDAYYQQMWDYGHGKEENGPGGPMDPLSMAMQAANMAMQRTAQTYANSELIDAWNHFNPGVVIISDLIYPFAKNGFPAMRVQQLADNLGMVLSALRPEVWSSDSVATKSLARKILDNYILKQPYETMIRPDSIRIEVDRSWAHVEPAFQQNPLRTSYPAIPSMK